MTHRNRLIALVCLEAFLWLVVNDVGFFAVLPPVMVSFGSAPVTLFQVMMIGALALALIIGMLSRGWQGAIALNLIASAPTLLVAPLIFHQGTNAIDFLSLMAPLAVLGWFGWLLRFARVEFTA